jgi:4-coumarate--CoA ligase
MKSLDWGSKVTNVVLQINEIPKSPSGKILRRVLRDKEKAGIYGLVVRDEAKAKL